MVRRTRSRAYDSVVNLDSLPVGDNVRNVIEFRRGSYPLPWDRDRLVKTVVVVIDGDSLSEHFLAAESEGFAVLLGDETATDLGIWGPNPPIETEAPEGYLPVLTNSSTRGPSSSTGSSTSGLVPPLPPVCNCAGYLA
jgi:hypothetical protein